MTWDPDQYDRFERERAQPFFDLLSRIPEDHVRAAADLGCGTGQLTRHLLSKWPQAEIWGVDDSKEMLERARSGEPEPRLVFVEDDLAHWRSPCLLDCILSNAALHWIPDHARLLAHLAAQLSPGGVLAVQIPNNRDEPAFRLLAELAADSLQYTVETSEWYLERLAALGLEAQVWETIYYHMLPDADAILEWLKGAALRPVLSKLDAGATEVLLSRLGEGIADLYPVGKRGVVFPFRRLFFTARRPA
ncbi:MAG TPA: methyltransferase domain-containing protein [Vicinamibacteria bacterium]|nr:methyltransferase domain-containing protein [Vicinamibacteria bacterium]